MGLILLLLFGLTSICGLSQFEAQEGHSITLRWDSPRKVDLSCVNIDCVFKSSPEKTLIFMDRGVEETQSQDRQFSGRVQCDREALRLGQVQIHLTRLTPQDSGEYQCEMAADDLVNETWKFKFYEHFVIHVTLPSDAHAAVTNSEGVQHGEDKKEQTENHARNRIFVICPVAFVVLLILLWLVATSVTRVCTQDAPYVMSPMQFRSVETM